MPRRWLPVTFAALAAPLGLSACRTSPPPPDAAAEPSASSASAVATASAAPTVEPSTSAAAPVSPSREPLTPERYRRYLAALGKGRKATTAKRWDAAIEAFGDALTEKPGDLRALAERGYARLLSDDATAALGDLDDALNGPADEKLRAQIHYNRGLAYEKLADSKHARQAFAASVAHNPTAAAKAKLMAINAAMSPENKGCVLDLDSEPRAATVVPHYRAAWALLRGSSKATEEEARVALHVEPDAKVTIVETDDAHVVLALRDGGDVLVVRDAAPRLFNGLKCPEFPKVSGAINSGYLQLTVTEELCETIPNGALIDWTSRTNGEKRVDHVWDLASARHVVSVVRTPLDVLELREDEVEVGSLDKCFEVFPRPL